MRIHRFDERSQQVLDILLVEDRPMDCRTLSEMLGFNAAPSLRHLFVCGAVGKHDTKGHGRSYRYVLTMDSGWVEKRKAKIEEMKE